MNLIKPKLGVLYSPSLKIDPLRNNLRKFGNVKLLDYTDTSNVDILIIPHGGGLNPCLPCFGDHMFQNNMCSEMEFWRIHYMDKYIDRGIPIIGIGDGACLLYQKLGGKITLYKEELRCIAADIEYVEMNDDGIFVNSFAAINKDFYGYHKFDVDINKIITNYTKIINDSGDDDTVILHPVNLSPSPRDLRNSNTK